MSRAVAGRLTGDAPLVHRPDEVRHLSQQVREAGRRTGLVAAPGSLPPLEADAAGPRDRRPSFAELAPAEPSPLRNQMTQHPPAYYVFTGAASAWLERPAAPTPFDRQVVILRLLGAALVVPLPLLAARTARRLGAGGATAVGAGLVLLAVPMLAHIGASVNNDTLLIAAGAVMTPPLVAAATGRVSPGATAAVGITGGLALLTKGLALFVPAWIVLAFGLGAWRAVGRRAVLGMHGLAALGLALAIGGWWWARNLAVVGELQPQHASLGEADAAFTPDWGWWVPFALLRFVRRFWLEPDVAGAVPPVEVVAMLALAGLTAAGVAVAARRARAAAAVTALAPAATTLAIVAAGSALLYRETAGAFGIHGRYTYAGLAGVAALAALPAALLPQRRRALAVGVAGAAVAAVNALAWLAALARYWGTPAGGLADSVRALAAWSPLPPVTLAVAALVFFAALAGATVLLARQVSRPAAPA